MRPGAGIFPGSPQKPFWWLMGAESGTRTHMTPESQVEGFKAPEIELVVADGPRMDPIRLVVDGPTTIGRSSDCDVVLSDPGVSRVHAVRDHSEGQVQLEDKESRGGVYLNLVRLEAKRTEPLCNRDLVGIGPWKFLVRLEEEEPKDAGTDARIRLVALKFLDTNHYLPAHLQLYPILMKLYKHLNTEKTTTAGSPSAPTAPAPTHGLLAYLSKMVVLSQPMDRVSYTQLGPLREDFDEIMELAVEIEILDGPIAFEEYVDDSFVRPLDELDWGIDLLPLD